MIAARPFLTLVHQTRSRWRFRIENYNQSFDWNVFKHELSTLFSEPIWSIRTNQWSKSLVIHYTESSSPSRVNHSYLIQSRVNQVLASLGINMAMTPLSPVEVVDSENKLNTSSAPGFVFWFANSVSALISVSSLLISFVLFIFGVLGILIPFSPGIWLIMLGSILFDLALFVRQPFIKVS